MEANNDATSVVLKSKRSKRKKNDGSDSQSCYNSISVDGVISIAKCLLTLKYGEQDALPTPNDNVKDEADTKITSRKSSGNSYKYVCKTCKKTFASFQALGGHRASHKKPKTTHHPEKKRPPSPVESSGDENTSCTNDPQQINNARGHFTRQSKHRFRKHYCKLCGTYFPSGQALGGHMRRHRAGDGIEGAESVEGTDPAESSEGADRAEGIDDAESAEGANHAAGIEGADGVISAEGANGGVESGADRAKGIDRTEVSDLAEGANGGDNDSIKNISEQEGDCKKDHGINPSLNIDLNAPVTEESIKQPLTSPFFSIF